jgi:hypothetical protein
MFKVLTTKQEGGTILLKTTEKHEEAVDYVEQCERATLRYNERNKASYMPRFYIEEDEQNA